MRVLPTDKVSNRQRSPLQDGSEPSFVASFARRIFGLVMETARTRGWVAAEGGGVC